MGGVAAVAAVGIITSLFAGIVAGVTNCKHVSDTIVQGGSFLQLKDHSDKLGYQHAVRHLKSSDYLSISGHCHQA